MQWNGVSPFEFDRKSMETQTVTWSEYPNGRKAVVKHILALKEWNKFKKGGLWESKSEIQIWIRSFEIQNLYQS